MALVAVLGRGLTHIPEELLRQSANPQSAKVSPVHIKRRKSSADKPHPRTQTARVYILQTEARLRASDIIPPCWSLPEQVMLFSFSETSNCTSSSAAALLDSLSFNWWSPGCFPRNQQLEGEAWWIYQRRRCWSQKWWSSIRRSQCCRLCGVIWLQVNQSFPLTGLIAFMTSSSLSSAALLTPPQTEVCSGVSRAAKVLELCFGSLSCWR